MGGGKPVKIGTIFLFGLLFAIQPVSREYIQESLRQWRPDLGVTSARGRDMAFRTDLPPARRRRGHCPLAFVGETPPPRI